MSELTGKVAIVTGASKGIGAAIAKGLAAAGASVAVNYASSREGADRVVAEISGKGGKAIAVEADVSKAADVQRLFDETKRAFGSFDVLVNNAGVYAFAPLEEVTEDEFHREFNINVLGVLLASREAVKFFGPDGGSITIRSPACWQRSWGPRKSVSTRSIREAWRPRACTVWGSSAANSKNGWWRALRWAAWGSRTTSRRWQCFWRRRPPAG